MGVTIHYSGKLKKASELKSMIDEVRDIAIEKNWKSFIFEDEFEGNTFTQEPEIDQLFGIMVTPPECEPICFSFLSHGKMCGIMNFKIIELYQEIDESIAFSLFTKTQYAGFEIHKEVVLLLEYVSNKYLTDFKCYDEAEYWETRDEDLLQNIFDQFDDAIDRFASSIEMMPQNEGEDIEDFIGRLADATQDRIHNSDENLPELSIEDENKFKRMKIELEHGGFFGIENSEIPPEIEGMFLDNIIQFENQFKNAQQITVLEKIGNPSWIKSSELTAEALEVELERLFNLLETNGIYVEVLYDYENESALIYDFITNELFAVEVNDISISGMMTNFIYEEFYPNHREDLKRESVEFWTSYFANNSESFDEFTLGDIENADELIAFRDSFSKFKKIKIKVVAVDLSLEEEKATTEVKLRFEAIIDKQDKVDFDCKCTMKFNHRYDYWYLKKVQLPR